MKNTRIFLLLCSVFCLILLLASCKDEEGHTHEWGAWETITPATCGAKGEEKRTCACGETQLLPIPATGAHTWSAWAQTTAPTCQTQGEQTSTCACGAVQRQALAVDLNNHTAWGAWKQTTAPTCVAVGEETRTCACGHEETCDVAVNPDAHTYNEETCCTYCSYCPYEGLVFTLVGDTYEVTDYNGTLSTVIIPSIYQNLPVTSIGEDAFGECTGLTSITIPASVTSIGSYAFAGCMGLESITVDSGNTVYHSAENCLIETASKTLVVGCKTSVIPTDGSVTSIGSYAFAGCMGLTSITIPANVTTIGEEVFGECLKLIEVYNLSALDIQAGNSDYGYVGNYAKNVYTTTTGSSKLFTDSNGYIFYVDGNTRYLMGYTGSDTVLTLPETCNGESYEIYQFAFSFCTGLTSITIPASVTSIGERAFYYCTGLTAITIPASVTSIGERAFRNCTGLTSITVDSGNTVYHSAGNCLIETASKTLILGCKNSVIPTDGSVTSIGAYAFSNCTGLTSITIPASVTSIGERAFYNCKSLTSVIIPDSVTSIGEYAFYGCTGLTSITIPKGVTSIGDAAFEDCTGLQSVTFGENSQLTSIGDYAFYGCTGLTSITIPSSVTTIGYEAFYGCTSLRSVDFGENSQLTSIGDDTFGDCTSLTSITLPFVGANLNGTGKSYFSYIFGERNNMDYVPTSLKTVVIMGGSIIDYAAFAGCSGLTSITIPSSVTSIGEYAFYDCTGLTSITIPASVTSIGSYAFSDCTGLTSITIPASVTSIGYRAFYNCTGLTTLYYGGSESEWNNISMGGSNTELTDATCYYYSATQPTAAGNYWHYDQNGNVALW